MPEEIYPMPLFPMLIAGDVQSSATWYQDVLGFKHIFTMLGPGGQPALVHVRWVKYADVLIAGPRDGKEVPKPRGMGLSLHFNMFDCFEGDIDAFAKQAREKGAIVSGPIDQPWNVREVTVLDPDGYQLVFSMPIHANLTFDSVMDRAQSG
jgi:uncharacterized glyoxalase superfamily protein PhnB